MTESNLSIEERMNIEQKARHDLAGKVNTYLWNRDEEKIADKVNYALLNQSSKDMKEDISKMLDEMKKGFFELNNKFDNLPEKFVSKDDHAENKLRIKQLEDDLKNEMKRTDKIDVKIAGYVGSGAVIVFFINFFSDKIWK